MKIFSVRDLFWLVLVAAMGCGWWVSYRQQAAEIERISAEWLKDIEGQAEFPTYAEAIEKARRLHRPISN